MKIRNIILAALLTATAAPAATAQAKLLAADKSTEYGLQYTLPLTALEVTVAVEKTVKTPGEFAPYAKKYLSTTPLTRPSTSWRVTQVVINPVAVPDPDHRYLVNFKGAYPVTMLIDERGFPLAINDDSYAPVRETPELPKAQPAQPTILDSPVALQAMTQDMLQSQSKAKRAQLAAERIGELRDERRAIASGQADAMPADGQAMALALKTLDDQEAALTAMFLGTTSTQVEVETFNVQIPEKGTLEREVLCRLSATQGLVPASDLTGDPIYIDVKELTRAELPINEKGLPKAFPRGGVAYRIPGEAQVSVDFEGKTVASSRVPVAQLGVVFGLDPAQFSDKKAPKYQHFHPLYGSLLDQGLLE